MLDVTDALLTVLHLFGQPQIIFHNLSNPRPGHTTGRSGRGGARTGRRWVDPARRQPLPLAPQRMENTVLNVSSEAPILTL